jgi:anti-anti-sigma factor
MVILQHAEAVNVSEIEELAAANACLFQTAVEQAMSSAVTDLSIDLSSTGYVDCCGLGALIALRNHARQHQPGCSLRVLNPSLPVRRLFDLAGANDLFSTTTSPRVETGPEALAPCQTTSETEGLGLEPVIIAALAGISASQSRSAPA